MEQLGQSQWVCEVRDLTASGLTERAGALWRAREKVREELQNRGAEMRERARENAVLIAERLYAS